MIRAHCDTRFEAKTRETPRPYRAPKPLPAPWSSAGDGNFSLVTTAGSAFVTISGGEVTVAAGDSREVLRGLAELLEWIAWRGPHTPTGDAGIHSSLCESVSDR